MGLSKSAKYYRENPEARAKKKKYDTKFNEKPSQVRKRTELNQENRDRGKYGNGDGKDLSHTRRGLVYKSEKANRGSKSDSAGDRRSRGGKK